MPASSTESPKTCPACGAPAEGKFCSSCGAQLGPRTCTACNAELSARARFCHRCGTPVPGLRSMAATPASRQERTAWIVAGGVVAVLLALIVWKMLGGTTGAKAPDMANAGNAGAGQVASDPGGSLPTGQAPDISQLSPQERFLRLNNRVMEAAARGDSNTVINFTPMALGAYSQLDSVTQDDRYHAAVLNAQVGRIPQALALTDTMLQVTPGYLLAYAVRGDIYDFRRDSVKLKEAYRDFLKAWPAESTARRAEYADHKNVLDDFRRRAAGGNSGS